MRRILFLLLGSFVFYQCTEHPETKKSAISQSPGETGFPATESTKKMAALVANAYAQIDPMKATYLVNAKRADIFNTQRSQRDVPTRVNAWSFYAYELLNTGKTEQAIVELESLLKEIPQYGPTPETMLQFKRLLAVAYLRLGEQNNCLANRNASSCFVPVTPEGQYTMTKGSESAMRICTEILNEFPDDDETIWLLNLAAMTIGQYPSGVPVKWRLPESYFTAGKEFPKFRDISRLVGIKGTGHAGGACMEDFDQDGWLDIICSSWGISDPLKFWKNDGKGGFIDATADMGLSGITGGLNILHSDINNDGLPDILVLRGAWLFDQGKIPNSLLLNLGNGHFSDITEQAGILTFAPTQTAVFADFNLDGWIDIFIGNESSAKANFENELWLNNRDGTFRNTIDAIGLVTSGYVKGCTAGDFNNDGLPDLYLSRYGTPNMLLINTGVDSNGNVRFEDVAREAGVQAPIVSFPCWTWDFNNDGLEDIFVSGYGEGHLKVAADFVRNANGETLTAYPRVYRNDGNLKFTDVSLKMGLRENVFTMGCNYGDLDADGYLDFYLGTGNPEFSSTVPNKMFRNAGGKQFEDVTTSGGFGNIQKGHAVAFGDLDHDGDEDLFEVMGGAFTGDVYENLLFENPIGQDNAWIILQLEGTSANRMAIGTRLEITVESPNGTHVYYRTVSTGGSFGSSSCQLEIGLGNATRILHVKIAWPDLARTVQIIPDLKLRSCVKITEGKDTVEYISYTHVPFNT